MQLPGLQALGFNPLGSQLPQVAGNNPAGNPFGPQGPQVSGTPSPLAGANLGGLPPAMGSGATNFAGLGPNAFSTIGASPLTPTYRPDLNAFTGVGNKLNFSC